MADLPYSRSLDLSHMCVYKVGAGSLQWVLKNYQTIKWDKGIPCSST